jgi:hypothetical protein
VSPRPSPACGSIAGYAGLLVAFLAASLVFAVRAFQTYQRSV